MVSERIRRGQSGGIGLKTLIYCVTWCARLLEDRDYQRLVLSVAMIKVWLLQGNYRDCVYKYLIEMRMDYAFEYVFSVADSFSVNFKVPDLKTSVKNPGTLVR